MTIRSEAYCIPDDGDMRTERVTIRVDQVYRYQECLSDETPGTVLFLESGDTPTIVMGYDDFDQRYRETNARGLHDTFSA